MAPLPVESTARYVVHYNSGANLHTQTWRVSSPVSPATFSTFLENIWGELGAILFAATISQVVFYPDGSVIGNPVAMPDFVGETFGSGAPTNVQQALYLDFVARSTGGRRYRAAFFSPEGTDPSWRFTGAEVMEIGNALTILNAMNDLCAIDGLPLNWKSYANNGYNAYWQRANRS